MNKLLTLLVLAGSITAAQAQETFFFRSTGDMVYRVGKTTKSFNNGLVMTTWLKIVDIYKNKYSLDLVETHCATGQYRLIKHQDYVNGGYDAGGWTDFNATWNYPIPGTLGEALKNLCN